MIDDAFKATWQRQFTPILHPHLPFIATLMETADKLNSARGFIEPLSHGVETEREHGMFVGNLAIRYAMTMLDHFGLGDGDDYPLPIHLDQAKNALANLVGVFQENIQLGQMAVGGPDDDEADDDQGISVVPPTNAMAPAIATAIAPPASGETAENKAIPTIDRNTFAARCGDKECPLGNTKEFQLLERLGKARGTFLEIYTLMQDVWPDSDPEKGTVQKTVSNLRKKLADAGLDQHFVIEGQPNHYRLVIR